ncbi:MAG: hypothetical protein FWD23_08465, partial [Oscillospiraceae bacterium]|nr:hypothetical protein [Oscillospiraceae bacterium]
MSPLGIATSTAIPDHLGKIAKKWEYENMADEKFGKCTEAANKIKDYLKRHNLHGAIIELEWSPRTNVYIGSLLKGKPASTNGFHVGVLYNGMVYCNIHTSGLAKQTWINDFYQYIPTTPMAMKLPAKEIPF